MKTASRRVLVCAASAGLAASLAAPAAVAHVSEMGFVLLLPTEVYARAGTATVAATVVLLALIPARWSAGMLSPAVFGGASAPHRGVAPLEIATSLIALAAMTALIAIGLIGARNPLANPLPLSVWTVFWIGLLTLQGVFGDLWRWLNPWTGAYALLVGDRDPPVRLPEWVGQWPGVVGLLVVSGFAFADPAPDDPARLAMFVSIYWAATLLMMMLVGREAWMARGECLGMLARLFAGLAPVRLSRGRVEIGLPGWRLLAEAPRTASMGVFALAALGVGSFDGLNETFWWMGLIGVNPLEFPGRSAIIPETVGGLLAATLLLVLVFAAAVAMGRALAGGSRDGFEADFAALALAVTPISFGYHIAHYLVTALVNGQYVAAAATDPLGVGADYLGLGAFYVTTGFLNTLSSVEAIFQTQAGAVVVGHVASVLMAHGAAASHFDTGRRATLSQIPLAAFMIGYTLLGLWLLASPKGA